MKKFLNIFILLLSFSAFAQSPADQLFDKANELYKQEKYLEAITQYETILTKYKQHSCDLHYNLGNAYYKLNKIGPAVYNYEKALMLNPSNKDARNNLKFAHNMMIDEVKDVPTAGFSTIVHRLTGSMLADTWAKFAIGAAFLFLAAFAGYYFIGETSKKRLFFGGMIVMMLAVVTFVSAAIFEAEFEKSQKPAIVFAAIASVKGEPKENASDAATIHEGTKVLVIDQLDGWHRVMLPDGSDGWILSESIKLLK